MCTLILTVVLKRIAIIKFQLSNVTSSVMVRDISLSDFHDSGLDRPTSASRPSISVVFNRGYAKTS